MPAAGKKQGNEFDLAVYTLVSRIPPGKVTSYGILAILAGRPGLARRVGQALKKAPAGLPCHRVVATNGRPVPGWAEQLTLLAAEGVTFTPKGYINMAKHRWTAE